MRQTATVCSRGLPECGVFAECEKDLLHVAAGASEDGGEVVDEFRGRRHTDVVIGEFGADESGGGGMGGEEFQGEEDALVAAFFGHGTEAVAHDVAEVFRERFAEDGLKAEILGEAIFVGGGIRGAGEGGAGGGPAGENVGEVGDIFLRVAGVDAEGVEFHDLAGVVFVQLAGVGAFLVEIAEHGGAGGAGGEEVVEAGDAEGAEALVLIPLAPSVVLADPGGEVILGPEREAVTHGVAGGDGLLDGAAGDVVAGTRVGELDGGELLRGGVGEVSRVARTGCRGGPRRTGGTVETGFEVAIRAEDESVGELARIGAVGETVEEGDGAVVEGAVVRGSREDADGAGGGVGGLAAQVGDAEGDAVFAGREGAEGEGDKDAPRAVEGAMEIEAQAAGLAVDDGLGPVEGVGVGDGGNEGVGAEDGLALGGIVEGDVRERV